jgi:hypothetical protein
MSDGAPDEWRDLLADPHAKRYGQAMVDAAVAGLGLCQAPTSVWSPGNYLGDA